MYLNEHSPSLGENPYWVFISFLYAWVAANIAERFSHVSEHWAEYKQRAWGYVPVWSHLTLAGFVVGTSWLGWTHAFVAPDVIVPDQVIAPSSLLLIVDFWILGTYFAFVAVVNEARRPSRDHTLDSPHSARPAYWLALILFAYVLWDFLTYLLVPRWTGRGDASHFWRHSWMSIFCAFLAFAFLFSLRRFRMDRPFWLLGTDLSLISLVLFYRALKQVASPSISVLLQIKNLTCHPLGSWLNGLTWGCFLAFVCLWLLAGVRAYRLTARTHA
jgi:hypothetical protein